MVQRPRYVVQGSHIRGSHSRAVEDMKILEKLQRVG